LAENYLEELEASRLDQVKHQREKDFLQEGED